MASAETYREEAGRPFVRLIRDLNVFAGGRLALDAGRAAAAGSWSGAGAEAAPRLGGSAPAGEAGR